MTSWTSISFDGSEPEQPLQPQILQVMQSVYRNASLPPPFAIDHWWHSPTLSYQVDDSGQEPSIVIINLREGRPDQPGMDTRFMINLNTMRVHDKFQDRRFPAPSDIIQTLHELREYVRSSLRRQHETLDRERQEARLRKQRQADQARQRVQTFYDHLLQHSVIDADDMEYLTYVTCPVCASGLESCIGCQVVSCANRDCQGSHVVPIERCSTHPTRKLCRPCIETQGAHWQWTIAPCPTCKRYYCSTELSWCPGLPQEDPNTSNDVGTSNITSTLRVHPPKPAPCVGCAVGGSVVWRQCDGIQCWSKMSQRGGQICSECVPGDGLFCVCSQRWLCDTCATSPSKAPLRHCPRCQKVYCYMCKYIENCRDCAEVTLCDDCIEEEGVGGTDKARTTQGVTLVAECELCHGKMCDVCSETKVTCAKWSCGRRLCRDCTERCCYCDIPLCQACSDDSRRRCGYCGNYSQSLEDYD
ncbi:hypothetical protein BV22DRAFT_1097271 [Leucogyrophana mollusca]|uniref:Uncharacterized protein n=1 Tax=Leucogyrophana mollusca TaxID=85980 RepID=A0ACB8B5C3_9AGAM|nr:hypothetical protein BV22DRAFT_1097271 [Leucogyrophana mollusca]